MEPNENHIDTNHTLETQQNAQHKDYKVHKFKEIISSIVASAAGYSTAHPFDTIKIRLQTQSTVNPLYKGTFDCLLRTIRTEGPLGLYKGFIPPLIGQAGVNIILFPVNSFVQDLFTDWNRKHNTLHPHYLSIPQLYASGIVAGSAALIVTQPSELLKSRLQVQGQGSKFQPPPKSFTESFQFLQSRWKRPPATTPSSPNVNQYAKSVKSPLVPGLPSFRQSFNSLKVHPHFLFDYRSPIRNPTQFSNPVGRTMPMQPHTLKSVKPSTQYHGSMDVGVSLLRRFGLIKGLGRGLWVTWLRETSFGIYFLSYESSRRILYNTFHPEAVKLDPSPHDLAAWQELISGSLAGVTTWASTYPLDVVKSRIQTQPEEFFLHEPHPVRKSIQQIIKTEGFSSLYRGFSATALRTAPLTGVTMVVLEWCKRFFGYYS